MSDKARPQSEGDKPAKPAGARTTAAKPRPGDADETYSFLAPPEALDEMGRLAHYRVLRILGKGGMGTVFMAEDTRLHRIVALKVMLPSIAKKAVARDRFIREAQATAKIEHDHIITIYEVNESPDGVPYAAMQFLKGVTLEDWLKAGKSLNMPQIMRISKEIAKGLAAAHARQLIHRDIKPSNIWLDATNKGRVKILDFGLARPTNEETHLTQEGMILGTPAYMSPEQARGQDVDERCDLFSLGCVMYRVCAGKLPFSGKDTMSMLLAITSDEPPPLQKLNADVPPALAELIHQLLAKKPEDRPASAKSVVTTLQDIERDWMASGATTASRPVGAAGVRDQTVADAKDTTANPALEDSAITEMELQNVPTSTSPAPPPRGRSWVFGALGGAAIAVLSLCCCAGINTLTDQGWIQIAAEDEAAAAKLNEVGLRLIDHHEKSHHVKVGSYWVRSGGYHVDPASLPEGLQVEPNPFTLGRGKTVELKVRSISTKMVAPAIEVVTIDSAKRLQAEWAKFLKRDIIETNSINMKLMLIPAGKFTMGSTPEWIAKNSGDPGIRKATPEYKKNLAAESPAHVVRISKPYLIGKFEVTYGQFSKFVAAMNYPTEVELLKVGGSTVDPTKIFELGKGFDPARLLVRKPEYNWKNTGFKQSNDHPVCNINWADAEAFCAWLSKKENRHYRLPTEAEWEYACRAGSEGAWHFGDDVKASNTYMWNWQFLFPGKKKDGFVGNAAHPVGQKPYNEFGLHDMHGNVEEMCSDVWSDKYYAKSPPDDPKGPLANPDGHGRVSRGGSFIELPHACRSAYRNMINPPTLGNIHVGFRVVCELSMPAE